MSVRKIIAVLSREFLLLVIATTSLLADAASFNFTYLDNEFNDFESRGWIEEGSLFRRNIEAAGMLWGARIDSSVSFEVSIAADRGALRAGGAPTTGRLLFTNAAGFDVWEASPLTRFAAASDSAISIQNTYDIELIFDPLFVEQNYWFDPEPETRLMEISSAQTGLIWVVMHELGHGLGMAGWRDSNPDNDTFGEFLFNANSIFDNLTNFDGNGNVIDAQGNPNSLLFNGDASMALFGGPVPITNVDRNSSSVTANFYHFGSCGSPAILLESLMNGCVSPAGRGFTSKLDVAMVHDLGYPTKSIVPIFTGDDSVLLLPFVIIPGLGVYELELVLSDLENAEFELTGIQVLPLGTAEPATLDIVSLVLAVPEVIVDVGGEQSTYAIELLLTSQVEPYRFQIIAADLLE